MRREIKNKKTINRHCWSHFFCPHHTFCSSPTFFAFKPFCSTFIQTALWSKRAYGPLSLSLSDCCLPRTKTVASGAKKPVTRLHIHTPPHHHSSHTRVVASVHMNPLPTCTCTVCLCFLSLCFLPFYQSLPIHRPPALQHDLLVTQVTEGWFERVCICSPPGRAGVWHSLGDECHPRK